MLTSCLKYFDVQMIIANLPGVTNFTDVLWKNVQKMSSQEDWWLLAIQRIVMWKQLHSQFCLQYLQGRDWVGVIYTNYKVIKFFFLAQLVLFSIDPLEQQAYRLSALVGKWFWICSGERSVPKRQRDWLSVVLYSKS